MHVHSRLLLYQKSNWEPFKELKVHHAIIAYILSPLDSSHSCNAKPHIPIEPVVVLPDSLSIRYDVDDDGHVQILQDGEAKAYDHESEEPEV